MFSRRKIIRKFAAHKKNRARTIETLETRQMFAADGLIDAAVLNAQDQLLVPPESAYVDCSGFAGTVHDMMLRPGDAFESRIPEEVAATPSESLAEGGLLPVHIDAALVSMNGGAGFVSTDPTVLHEAFKDLPPIICPLGSAETALTTESQSITLGAFKLTDVIMEEAEDGYRITGFLEAPGIERVRLTGFVSNDLSRYNLKSDPATLKVGPVELKNSVTTLDEKGLTVTGEWTHSLVGTVTFTGKIGADGAMSLKATTPPRSFVGGLVKTEPGQLTLTPEGVSFIAQGSVDRIGIVTFTGKISENGSYEITGSAGLKIAGFTIEGASLSLGEESLGVSCVIPIEGLGDVEVSGAYGPDGKWLLYGKYPGSITIGPVVLNDPNITVTDEFVRANCIGTIVDLEELVEADLTTTFFYDGRIESVAVTDILEIGGFRLGRSTVVAGNNNPEREYKVTLHSVVGVKHLFDSVVTGEIDEHGNYVLRGNATVTLGGYKLSNATITVEKGKGLTIRAEDKVLGSQVVWTGTVDNKGNYSLRADATAKIAGLTFSNATFTLTKKDGLRFEGKTSVLNATVTLRGSVSPNGKYKLEGDGNVTFLGIGKHKTHFVVENNKIRGVATVNVLGTNVKLVGDVHANGSYRLSFEGDVRILGFKMADATVTLDKYGLECNGEIKVLGQTIKLSGGADARGNVSLHAFQNVKFEGLTLSAASFKLDNDGLAFRADFRNFGFNIGVKGTVESNGLVEFNGRGAFAMGEIEVDVYLHPGKDVYKLSLEGKVDIWVMKGTFFTKIVKGRDGWPEPELSGTAKVKGALGSAISKYTGDIDFTVSAKKVTFEHKDRVVKIQGEVTVENNRLNCKWKVTNRQTGWSLPW